MNRAIVRSLAIATAALLAAGLVACNSSRPAASAPEVVRDLTLAKVESLQVPDTFSITGTVHASETAQLSAQMMGNVTSVRVHEGDRVARGQVLLTIDAAQPAAALDRATAGVKAAEHDVAAASSDAALTEATLRRYQTLYDRKSVSPQEFDEVKTRAQGAAARREMAQAGLNEARAAQRQASSALGYTQIRAPFAGVVTERRVDPGVLAAPGMPLLTVEGSGRFRLEASIDENDLRDVTLGKAIPVTLDALGESALTGKVTQIVPAADAASRSFTVKIELPEDPALRSGLYGRAQVARGVRNAIVVPRSSVVTRGALQGVYVAGADGILRLRYVTLGTVIDNRVEILSGLSAGEMVVAAPAERELGGKRIEVR